MSETRDLRSAPLVFAVFCVVAITSTCSSPAAPAAAQAQTQQWGSDEVGLAVSNDTARLQFAASGGNCYGSSGEIQNAGKLTGTFTLAGSYTQLIGATPGSRQYAAEYSGSINGDRMTLSVRIVSWSRASAFTALQSPGNQANEVVRPRATCVRSDAKNTL